MTTNVNFSNSQHLMTSITDSEETRESENQIQERVNKLFGELIKRNHLPSVNKNDIPIVYQAYDKRTRSWIELKESQTNPPMDEEMQVVEMKYTRIRTQLRLDDHNNLVVGNFFDMSTDDIQTGTCSGLKESYSGQGLHGRRHGQGTLTDSRDYSYKGQWFNDQKHGFGIEKVSGRIYEGEWKNDKMNGKGTYTDLGNYVYEGQFVDGLREGSGIEKFTNGDVYNGEWKQGLRHGQGTLTLSNNEMTFTGQWVRGSVQGQGTITWTNRESYTGEWLNGQEHGYGIKKWVKGVFSEYHGYWERGQIHGKGTIILPDNHEITSDHWGFREEEFELHPS